MKQRQLRKALAMMLFMLAANTTLCFAQQHALSTGYEFDYNRIRCRVLKTFNALPMPPAPTASGENTARGGEVIGDVSIKVSDTGRTGFITNDTKLEIPRSVKYGNDWYRVTEIQAEGFYGCYALEELVLPDCINTIGVNAFKGCTGLKKVTFPTLKSWATINFKADDNTTDPFLSNPLAYASELEILGYYNDEYGRNHWWNVNGESKWTAEKYTVENLKMPSEATQIYPGTFYKYKGLKSLDLNDVIYIGQYAFYSCENLSGSVDFSNIEDMGAAAFANDSKLTGDVNLSKMGTTIHSHIFSECTGLDGTLTLPEEVQYIGDRAFIRASKLKGKLNFTNNLTHIGFAAFCECNSLTNVENGLDLSGVEDIKGYAFKECINLTGPLKVSDQLKKVGEFAFMNDSLMTGNFNDVNAGYITSVGNAAFTRCKNLTGGVDLSNVTIINDYIFKDCPKLDGTLKLSSNLTSIGTEAFKNDSLLKISTDYLNNSQSLGSIGWAAFAYCKGLKGELNVPASTTKIYDYAFRWCTGLTKLNIPKDSKLEYIGEYAFHRCEQMRGDLFIPTAITEIKEGAFGGCLSLGKADTEGGEPGKFILHDDIEKIGNLAFSHCENLPNWGGDELQCKLPKNIKEIGNQAFRDCYKFNGTLTIPASLTDTIQYAAFARCSGIDTLKFEAKSQIKVIGSYAFRYCTDLKSIEIPSGVHRIGYMAFQNCNQISNLILPETVDTLWFNAFQDLRSLKVVKLPNSLRQIEAGTFSHNESNYHISFPSRLEVMGLQNVLTKNKATEITVPATVHHIFQYEEWLKEDGTDLYADYEETENDPNIAVYTYHDKQTNIKNYFFMQSTADALTDMLNNGDYRYYIGTVDEEGVYDIDEKYTENVEMKNRSVWNMFKERLIDKGVTFYVKPSVYNAVKQAVPEGNEIKVDYKIPVTFKAGLQFTTLCRDFDIDLTAKIIDDDGNPTQEKLSSRLRAFIPVSYNQETGKLQMTEVDYIPSRTLANSKGNVFENKTQDNGSLYTGIDQYHGIILMRTGDCSQAETLYYAMGEDDYSKGKDGQMGVSEKSNDNYMQSGSDLNKLLANSWLVGLNDEAYIKPSETVGGKTYNYYGLSGGRLKQIASSDWCNGYNKAIFRISTEDVKRDPIVEPAKVIERLDGFEVIENPYAGGTTKITYLGTTPEHSDNYWYTLGGMRLNNRPTQKGIYVYNGKKVIL